MIQKTKRPISILLVLLMIVGMFTVLPISAGAADYVDDSVSLYNLDAGDTLSVNNGELYLNDCREYSVIFKGGTYRERHDDQPQADDIQFQAGQVVMIYIMQDYNGPTLVVATQDGRPEYYPLDAEGNVSDKWYVLSKDDENFTITLGGHAPAADTWTFRLNSNFSGQWNADTDVVSEQPIELTLAKGDYEFQIVAYKNGNLSSFRGNEQAGSFTETYSQTMHDNGGNAKFHADGGKYTLTYNAGTGLLTINPVYVAEIDGTNYKTLEAAFAAAADGNTITLLADCAGNGIKAPQGKFATNGLTVDFAGFTYTVDGETVGSSGTETNGFQLLKDNKITFQNGTITSAKAKILVQNYSDLTLDNMTLTLNNPNYTSAYTLSNNNGNIVIDDTTINANPAGGFAFDVCRYASYPSVNVTVKGNSQINGDVEVYASGSNAKDGFSLTLESGAMTGNIVLDQTAKNVIAATPEKAVISKEATFDKAAPADYKWNDSGVLVPVKYVAQIGTNKYETLEAAFAAAQDGDTITLLADCAGNGIKAPQGKFGTGLTVDFAGFTYTVDGETVGSSGTETNGFQLLKDNKITFQNGTITSAKAKILVQNYSDLTLDNMTLTLNNPNYTSAYTLSNNNGNIVIDDTTINANPAGGFAFDVCRYASYPSVNVTVKGNSQINGDVEVYASGSNAKDGFSLTLESGAMTGNIVLDQTAKNVIAATPEKAVITKAAAFEKAAPEGYEWVDNGDGTSTLAHVHDWDYENVTWTFTENASHSIYAKYTLTCKTDPTHTKEQTGSGTLMSTVAVDGDKFVYSHSAVKIDGISVAVPNYTRNVADGIINQYELKAAVKVAGNYKLANDITGFYDNVKPVDGFVLDGQNHMIKYGTMNAGGRVMFVAADQNTKFTLKNITLDGNNRAKWAVCAYTGNSGNNAGNVITLDTVTIQNFKSNDYVGAINAFGSSTWNLKDCTITGNTTVDDSDGLSGSAVWAGSKATINIDGGTYDEVYLHSYSGTGAVLNADGGATIDNLVLDLTKTDTLKANIDEATVGAITSNEGTIPEEAVVMDPAKATVAAPEGYKWVDSDETGMKTLAQIVYVAQIGDTKYETLEAAFAAAVDGDTITLLADCAGNGIKVTPAGKFATGLTVDFDGHTYTVDGTTVGSTGTETLAFQLLKNNKVTFKNGTIYSEKAKMLVQNYCDLTLDSMTLTLNNPTYNGAYTLSNNNGNVVINDTTINANPTPGSKAFDVCRYSSYPSVNVTVKGDSKINGDVEIYASKGQAKDGFSLTLESGTMTGDIVVDPTAQSLIGDDNKVTKADAFTKAAPEGYVWRDNGNGTSTLVKAPDLFVGYGLSLQGDIGLIFYLDPAAAGIDIADVNSVAIDFDCDHYTYHVTDSTKSGDYIKVTCYVPAAYMAHDIKAYNVKINGVALDDTDTYSVQKYAERIIKDPVACNIDADKADEAVALMKEMLNYGAKAQEVFKNQMEAPADYDDIAGYTMATVTADMIDAAIKGKATDMSTVHPEADANFYAPSVIYLSKTTLRMIFLIPTGNGSTCPDEYSGKQAPWYYWKDVTDIPAAELDEQQQFEINGVTFNYSVLDYAKAVVTGGSPAQKDLAASLYLYNQAANAFFAD